MTAMKMAWQPVKISMNNGMVKRHMAAWQRGMNMAMGRRAWQRTLSAWCAVCYVEAEEQTDNNENNKRQTCAWHNNNIIISK
jgi:hypothetical protein